MYRRYYDGYRNTKNYEPEGEIVVPQTNDTYSTDEKSPITLTSADDTVEIQNCYNKNNILGTNCELDDIILIGILLFLIMDNDSPDPVILVIIGFIFLSEIL